MSDEIAIGHLQKRQDSSRGWLHIPSSRLCREKFVTDDTGAAGRRNDPRLAAEEGAKWAGSFGGDVAGLRSWPRRCGPAAAVWTSRSSTRRTIARLHVDPLQIREFFKELGLEDSVPSSIAAGITPWSPGSAMTSSWHAARPSWRAPSCCDFRFRRRRREERMTGVLDDYLVDPGYPLGQDAGYRLRSGGRVAPPRAGRAGKRTRPRPS